MAANQSAIRRRCGCFAGRLRRRMAVVFLFSALAACSSASENSEIAKYTKPQNLSPEQCSANAAIVNASTADHAYMIQPGDDLSIDFYLNSEFNQDVIVRPDGKVSLRMVGAQQAAGLSPRQLADELNNAYLSELTNPGVTVSVKSMPNRQIYVQGMVEKPGAFPLESGMTALQAVAQAGGLTKEAGDKAVLIRRDACGVPFGTPLDLSDAMSQPAGGADMALEPRDILVVPRSTIANMDKFVEQYIRNLLPIQPYASFPM